MTPLVNCPTCDRSLGRVQADGTLRALCPSCRTTYGAFFGRLSRWSSRLEPLFYLNASLPSVTRRRYEFRVTTPGRSIQQLTFTLPGKLDRVPVYPGDRISVLYTTGNGGSRDAVYRLDKLMAIYNHSRSHFYRFPVPIPSRRHLTETQGSMSTALGLGAFFGGIHVGLISLGALSLLFSARLTDVAQLKTPELQLSNREDARLLEEIKLSNQKLSLEQRITQLRQDIQEAKDLVQQLQALRSKMFAFNPQLYATRVSNLETAIRLLKQRAVHDHRLIEEYRQTIQMIEIELEAYTLAEHLPDIDDFIRQIYQRLEELKSLEAENQNIRLQLAAHEELRRLIPDHRGSIR